MDPANTRWLDRVDRARRPIYLAVVEALRSAVAGGELRIGERLPPQRLVAARLGVDLTTVTRAYAAAGTAGLIEGAVGRGTYVAGRGAGDDAGVVDLSMNLPPPPLGLSLDRLLQQTLGRTFDRADAQSLMAYHPPGGSPAQRAAAAAWCAPCLGQIDPERLLVAPGAQAALAALLGLLTAPGDRLLVEPLTYPGLRAAAAHFGLRLVACPVDAHGPIPAELARLCAQVGPKAVYLVPTHQNPTALTMPPARRAEIAAACQAAGVPVIEDDAYGRLPARPTPSLATLAPGLVWRLETLSKTLSPGLRVAFVAAPDAAAARRLAQALRATSIMPSPLGAAVAAAWIGDGTAETLLAAIRAEAQARQALARGILPAASGEPDAIHLWLDLPDHWPSDRLRDAAQARGLSLVGSEAFAAAPGARSGLRLSLGGPVARPALEQALGALAALLAEEPAGRLVV